MQLLPLGSGNGPVLGRHGPYASPQVYQARVRLGLEQSAVRLILQFGVALLYLHIDRGRPVIQTIHALHLVDAALDSETRRDAVLLLDKVQVGCWLLAAAFAFLVLILLQRDDRLEEAIVAPVQSVQVIGTALVVSVYVELGLLLWAVEWRLVWHVVRLLGGSLLDRVVNVVLVFDFILAAVDADDFNAAAIRELPLDLRLIYPVHYQ